MKKIAYKEMFENELTHPWYLATRKLLIQCLKKYLKKNSKILDAGCGTGGTILALRQNGYRNIYGVDKSKEALAYCRKRKLRNVSYGNVNKLNFKKNSFDAIICLDVLYHKEVNAVFAFNEFIRILKPGGIVYLQEPAYNWLQSSHDRAIQTSRRFKASEIQLLANSLSLKTIKRSYFNTLLFPLIVLQRLKNKSQYKKFRSDVYKLPTLFRLLISFTFSLELVLLRFINFPFGLSIISICRK